MQHEFGVSVNEFDQSKKEALKLRVSSSVAFSLNLRLVVIFPLNVKLCGEAKDNREDSY